MQRKIDVIFKCTIIFGVILTIYRIILNQNKIIGLIEGLFTLLLSLLIELIVGLLMFLSLKEEVKANITNKQNSEKN